MAERDLVVRIIGDDKSYQRSLNKATASTNKFAANMKSPFARAGVQAGSSFQAAFSKTAFAGALGAAGLFAGVRASVEAASDLNEQIAKSQQVFQDSADSVLAWSKTTADAIGVSERAALTAAGTFGNLFSTVGLDTDKAAEMSQALVQLAADLASFNNANPEDVLDALRSGLIGEAEPLRKFGVLLSETRVQQEAMAETGKTNAKSLTDQEKALARYQIILKDTVPAQGDFARTSDGAANAGRRLSANVEDLKANIGSGLVPALARATGLLADFTGAMKTASASVDDLVNSKAFRDKFAAAFGAEELFKVLNQITSEGLTTRPDEGASKAGAAAGKSTGDAIAKAFADAVERAMAIAKGEIAAKVKKGKAAINAEAAEAAAEKARVAQRNAFDELAANLGLNVDQDLAKKAFAKALSDNEKLQAAIRKQIGVEGRTAELARQLFTAQQEHAAIIAEQASAAADARKKAAATAAEKLQSDQFRALGLAASGEEIVPGAENLAKRLKGVLGKISSGELDVTSKLADRLRRAQKLVRSEGGKLTEETRRQIDSFIKAANGGDSKKLEGPLTNTSSLNANKIVQGLGLDASSAKAIKARLSSFNTAGVSLAGDKRPTGAFASIGGAIVVENINTTVLDGDVVGRNVTRSQQKQGRRNPRSKRGGV